MLGKDGSFATGMVRNGRYQYTLFGEYEYAADTLVVTLENGKAERGGVEWVGPDAFRYRVTGSANKAAIGRTIEYKRVR